MVGGDFDDILGRSLYPRGNQNASMNILAQQAPILEFAVFAFLIVGAFLATWAVIVERLMTGATVLPYRPRRRVPWQIWDLLAVIFCFFYLYIIAIKLIQFFFSIEIGASSEDAAGKVSAAHPSMQLLASGNWMAIILCILIIVIMAPVIEEMFFRVFVQGWLEKCDRSLMYPGAMPIVVSSLIFASQHFRRAGPSIGLKVLVLTFIIDAAIKVVSLIFFIVWTRYRVGATAIDFGWAPRRILPDLRLGLIAFLAVAAPIYGMQTVLSAWLPRSIAPDPVAIFFFAIALGILYYRTHRAAPSIALHMALNASSLAMYFIFGG
jgi:membrane protease YdiL (CAAX protease family)